MLQDVEIAVTTVFHQAVIGANVVGYGDFVSVALGNQPRDMLDLGSVVGMVDGRIGPV